MARAASIPLRMAEPYTLLHSAAHAIGSLKVCVCDTSRTSVAGQGPGAKDRGRDIINAIPKPLNAFAPYPQSGNTGSPLFTHTHTNSHQ